MRKLYFILMALLVSVPVLAQVEQEEENPGGWDFTLPINIEKYKPHSERRWIPDNTLNSSSFSLGFIGEQQADAGVALNMGESFELEWGNISSAKARLGKNAFIRIGWGIAWRNHRMTSRQQFCLENDGTLTLQDYPEGATPKFSRIKTFGITIPLKYYQRLGKNVFFAAGPELEYVTHASALTRYTVNGEKKKIKEKDLKYNHFQFGIGAEVSLHNIGLYYKYTPTSVLQDSYGPKFGTQTVGIKLSL